MTLRPPAASACAREPALRAGSRGPFPVCVRARPRSVGPRDPPPLSRLGRSEGPPPPSRTAPADVRVHARRVVGRGAVAPPPSRLLPRLRAPASAASPAFESRFRHLSSFSRTGAETLLEGSVEVGRARARAATGGFGCPSGGRGAAAAARRGERDGQRPGLFQPASLPPTVSRRVPAFPRALPGRGLCGAHVPQPLSLSPRRIRRDGRPGRAPGPVQGAYAAGPGPSGERAGRSGGDGMAGGKLGDRSRRRLVS